MALSLTSRTKQACVEGPEGQAPSLARGFFQKWSQYGLLLPLRGCEDLLSTPKTEVREGAGRKASLGTAKSWGAEETRTRGKDG